MSKQKWRTIGEVCVDSGTIVICDPCNAEEARERWRDRCMTVDLNECAIKGIRTWQATNERDCPIAVVADSGLGDGVYAVEARYEDLGECGKRVAEVRIKFLPHPYLSGGE